MFKILSIIDAASAVVDLKHPISGEPLGASVTLAGPEHATRKALDFAKQRRLRKSFQKTGKFELGDPADDELDLTEKLVACTLDWKGFTDDAGTEIPYSKSAVSKLYATDGLGWLRAQVLTAMDERERFITACATS